MSVAPTHGILERAQRAAEAHLAACEEAFWWEEGETDVPVESPASAPFDGCDTCVVREVLFAAWTVLEEAHELSTTE